MGVATVRTAPTNNDGVVCLAGVPEVVLPCMTAYAAVDFDLAQVRAGDRVGYTTFADENPDIGLVDGVIIGRAG